MRASGRVGIEQLLLTAFPPWLRGALRALVLRWRGSPLALALASPRGSLPRAWGGGTAGERRAGCGGHGDRSATTCGTHNDPSRTPPEPTHRSSIRTHLRPSA